MIFMLFLLCIQQNLMHFLRLSFIANINSLLRTANAGGNFNEVALTSKKTFLGLDRSYMSKFPNRTAHYYVFNLIASHAQRQSVCSEDYHSKFLCIISLSFGSNRVETHGL